MKHFFFGLVFLLAKSLFAQLQMDTYIGDISLNPGQMHTEYLRVENMGSDTEKLYLHLPQIYGAYRPFSSPNSDLVLAPGSVDSFRIDMLSEHNLNFNSYIFVERKNKEAIPVEVNAQLRYANSYYASTFDLREETLKRVLRNRISNHNGLSYNAARDNMFLTIDNKRTNGQGATQNTLECPYTGREAVGFSNRQDAQNNYSFNTEHTFPQGFFNSLEPMKSDMFHLYPVDESSNSQRSNLPFGLVTNPSWTEGGSKKGNGKFEPRDAHKGAVARAMLYFVTRYGDYQNFFPQQEEILKTWNRQHAPNAQEQKRNLDIQAIQNNRNPFIDYPVFAERIHRFTSPSVNPNAISYKFYPQRLLLDTIDNTDTISLYLYNSGDTVIELSSILFSSVKGEWNLTSAETEVHPKSFIRLRLNPAAVGVLSDSLLVTTNPPSNKNEYIYCSAYIKGIPAGISANKAIQQHAFSGPVLRLPSGAELMHLQDIRASVSRVNYENTESLSPGLYFGSFVQKGELHSFKFLKY